MRAASKQAGAEVIDTMEPLDVMAFAMRLVAKEGQWLRAAELGKYDIPVYTPEATSCRANEFRTTEL